MTPLDKETFDQWATSITSKLDKLLTRQSITIVDEDGNKLLDNSDICKMLHVSKRTLQRYRASKTLPYQMIYHKTYYREKDVFTFIESHFSNFLKKKQL